MRLLAAMLGLSVFGCILPAPEGTKPQLPAGVYAQPAEAVHTPGSLWPQQGSPVSLFSDTKAHRVGDIVTVHITESATGSKDAETKTGRTSSIDASASNFLGLPAATVTKLNASGSFTDAFDGSGSTTRTGALTADITTVVTEVLPNGNLVIEGQRDVTINSEKETITLRGVIRPEDISTSNVILSTYVADATIKYAGTGVIHDKQRPGWAIRILDWIWPF